MQINYAKKEVSCKLVYYGPGMSGKTTNLEIIHKKVPQNHRGNMTSIATEGDRTLFFDFLPLDLGKVRGLTTKFQLYTVPGQVYYASTRKLVLQGADGIIFVADSAADKIAENIESLEDLKVNLQEYGLSITEIPLLIQWNKRDLPNALPVEELNSKINNCNAVTSEAVAATGEGVISSLKLAASLVLERLNNKDPSSATAKPAAQMNQEPAKEKVEVFVAKVNSDNITRDYYNGYCQTQYRLSVVDAESIEDFKKFNDEDRLKLLNSLINYVLLLQDAKKRNLVVSKEELSKQLSSFAKKFKSKAEMQTFLSERKLVMDNLTNEATRNIITGKIITEVVPNLSEKMKITEQDVKEFYNENREKFGDKSPSEIKDRLVMMVKNARRRTLLNEFFENLRKNAEVQIYEDKL